MGRPNEIAAALDTQGAETLAQMRKRLAEAVTRLGSRGTFRANYIASGTLYNSLASSTEIQPGRVVNTIEGSEYWPYVDKGRGPGLPPPTSRIEAWQKAKGGNVALFSSEAIARAIGLNGTSTPPSLFATVPIQDEGKRLDTALPQAAEAWLIRETDAMLLEMRKLA